MPERRYDKAKRLTKILNVLYLKNSPVSKYGPELQEIGMRNNSFILREYLKMSDLKNPQEDLLLLVTP